MPTATFQADFSQWNTALSNAQKNLKSFEVAAGNVGSQLKRAFATFSGEKVIREANLAAAAVEKLGGVSKLTASEQARLNATVTEALAKYKALGQTAPAELRKLQKETAGVNTAMSGIGKTVLKIGGLFAATFTVGALTRAAKAAVDLGGELADLSARTGLSTQALQEFRYAGGQVGVSMDAITSAVGQMQKRLAGGDQSAVSALKHLGLSLKELRSLRPEDQFAALAAKIKDIEDPAARAKLAMDVMGKGALEVMPLLLSNLEQVRQKARDLGLVLDDETIAALDEMGDTLDTLAFVGQALVANVLKPLAPHLKDLSEFALSAAGSVKLLSDALTFAQTTFTAVLMIADKTAAAFTELQAAALKFNRATNPLAAAMGFLDQQIADATKQAEQYRTTGNLLQQDIDNQIQNGWKPHAKAVADSTKAIKPFIVANDEAAKKLRELTDQLSGAAAIKSLDLLVAAWKSLPPALRESAAAQDHFLDEYVKLSPALVKVPPRLAAVVTGLNKMALAAGKFSADKIVKGLSSLEGIATTVNDSFTTVFADMLEFETKVTKTSEDISAVIQSAFKIDERTESNFITTALDINDRLALINKTGLDRQLAELQISKARELAALKANHQLTVEQYEELAAKIEAIYKQLEKEIKPTFGTQLTKNLTEALGNIPQIITDALVHGASFEDIAAAIGTQIGAAIGGAIGFALGGPLGAKIGEALGSLLGPLLDSLIQTRAEETQVRIREEFGVAISEGLAQAIEDAAKELGGNREAAKLLNLDKIISEGGGVAAENYAELADRLRDVFSLVEQGNLSLEQAQTVLDKNFKSFVDYLGGHVTPALKDIIRLNDQLGTQSKAISEFTSAAARQGIEGIGGFVATRGDIFDKLEDAQHRLADLIKNKNYLDRSKPYQPVGSFEDIRKAKEEVAKLTGELGAIPIASQAAASAIGGALFGSVDRLMKNGESMLEVLREMGPTIVSWERQLTDAGFTGGAAFDRLRAMAALANDAIAGPVLTSIEQLTQGLVGLNDADILTPEMFSGITEEVTTLIGQLQKQGKTMNEIYPFVSKSLQEIWELQQDYNFAVDATTQKLLDEAEAAGIVGDEHRSVQEQMLIAMDRTAEAVEALAVLFGAQLPKAIKKTADEVEKLPKDVRIRVNYDTERFPEQPTGPTGGTGERPQGYAKGGVVYAQHGIWAPRGTDTVPAMLTPGEVVLPREVVAALRASSGGGAVTVNLSISAIDGADVERVVKSPEFRRALTSAVKGNLDSYRTDLRTAMGVR